MVSRLIKVTAFAAGLISFAISSASAADVLSGASTEALILPCAGCHGNNGISKGPAIPTIAGFKKKYFVKTMKKFKDGERNSTIMSRIAKGYSDDEIEQMGKYYEKLPFVKATQKFDAALAKKGAAFHEELCESCHKEQGQKPKKKGLLAGQWSPYIRQELHNFFSEKRDMSRLMGKRMKKLGKENLEAMVNFYASVK